MEGWLIIVDDKERGVEALVGVGEGDMIISLTDMKM